MKEAQEPATIPSDSVSPPPRLWRALRPHLINIVLVFLMVAIHALWPRDPTVEALRRHIDKLSQERGELTRQLGVKDKEQADKDGQLATLRQQLQDYQRHQQSEEAMIAHRQYKADLQGVIKWVGLAKRAGGQDVIVVWVELYNRGQPTNVIGWSLESHRWLPTETPPSPAAEKPKGIMSKLLSDLRDGEPLTFYRMETRTSGDDPVRRSLVGAFPYECTIPDRSKLSPRLEQRKPQEGLLFFAAMGVPIPDFIPVNFILHYQEVMDGQQYATEPYTYRITNPSQPRVSAVPKDVPLECR